MFLQYSCRDYDVAVDSEILPCKISHRKTIQFNVFFGSNLAAYGATVQSKIFPCKILLRKLQLSSTFLQQSCRACDVAVRCEMLAIDSEILLRKLQFSSMFLHQSCRASDVAVDSEIRPSFKINLAQKATIQF